MAYPFVKGISYGARKGPVKAFVVHMAEGGGTVGFLKDDATPPARGVSVHYVIEYTGRIVQMLVESDASGSINPQDLRTTEGPAPYGATVRKQVMGDWDHDPNSAVISVEIEGFAADGPNTAEAEALVRLVDDVRSRFPAMGLLGHRDFQDYKSCPGAHIDWAALGGHGVHQEEDDMRNIIVGSDRVLVDVVAGTPYYDAPNGTLVGNAGAGQYEWLASPTLDDGLTRDPSWCLIVGLTADLARVPSVARYIKRAAAINPRVWPTGTTDCTAEVNAATEPLNLKIQTLKAKGKGHAAEDKARADAYAADIAAE